MRRASAVLICMLWVVMLEALAASNFFGQNYATGLVGWWRMCGDVTAGGACRATSATAVADSSGNGNGGTWSGTAAGTTGYYAAGKVGPWAGMFNGTNNAVTLTSSAGYPAGSASRPMTAWVYYVGSANYPGYQAVMAYGTAGYYQTSAILLQTGTGDVGFDEYGVAGFSTYVVTAGAWHFVATSYTAASSNAVVCMDGACQSVALGHVPGTVLSVARIGSYTDGTDKFNGLIDDVRIYNRALSNAEMQMMYLSHN